ncbi:GNAT family N-acetyltransferase [Deinococcus koreensis]|uniref:GNAT family N-acetyltransferase n=1 Tax=Deinococcus koreensis TaxID=2054903 RepID=UPI001FB040B7|nr:GNAT family N-acetyltransferase [Deinococcus koreensis]
MGRIAYQTGFFGDSAARYFPDSELFAALWAGPYFQGAGAGCYVAEAGGEVLGYVLGAPEHERYQAALRRVVARRLSSSWPTRRTLLSLRYLLRVARFPSPHASWAAFPAHLHLNLLPAARGLGLGRRLLEAHLAALQGLGVGGVQLSTTAENRAALGLYRTLGFEVVASRRTPLWTPWLRHEAEHLAMARRLDGGPIPAQG